MHSEEREQLTGLGYVLLSPFPSLSTLICQPFCNLHLKPGSLSPSQDFLDEYFLSSPSSQHERDASSQQLFHQLPDTIEKIDFEHNSIHFGLESDDFHHNHNFVHATFSNSSTFTSNSSSSLSFEPLSPELRFLNKRRPSEPAFSSNFLAQYHHQPHPFDDQLEPVGNDFDPTFPDDYGSELSSFQFPPPSSIEPAPSFSAPSSPPAMPPSQPPTFSAPSPSSAPKSRIRRRRTVGDDQYLHEMAASAATASHLRKLSSASTNSNSSVSSLPSFRPHKKPAPSSEPPPPPQQQQYRRRKSNSGLPIDESSSSSSIAPISSASDPSLYSSHSELSSFSFGAPSSSSSSSPPGSPRSSSPPPPVSSMRNNNRRRSSAVVSFSDAQPLAPPPPLSSSDIINARKRSTSDLLADLKLRETPFISPSPAAPSAAQLGIERAQILASDLPFDQKLALLQEKIKAQVQFAALETLSAGQQQHSYPSYPSSYYQPQPNGSSSSSSSSNSRQFTFTNYSSESFAAKGK